MSELKSCVAPLTATPELSPPPHMIQPAPKRMPWATIRTTPSIKTATTRIQNPAGRVAALALGTRGAKTGSAGLRGGGGNVLRGAPEAGARAGPHPQHQRRASPRQPPRPTVHNTAPGPT